MAEQLSEQEKTQMNMVFSVFSIRGEMDASNAASAVRALGLNPTIALINSFGGCSVPGERFLNMDQFIGVYLGCKADKDAGVYEDFIECLKLYDKAENGYMQLAELTNMLTGLGESLSTEELHSCYETCMDEEDDDGFIPYVPFLARMCEKPVPKNIKPE